ncbi:MAG: OmpA family protein [Gammaproteobacteria bacterium]|nr:OmpA family protein [Gammaproteobacteria bacterium]
MKLKSRWLVLSGLLALSGPAVADEQVGPRAGKVYLTPGMAIYRAPDGEDLRGGPAIGVGYMVNRNLGLELLYSDVKVDRDGVVASRQDASGGKGRKAELFWANALYKVGGTERFQPFTLFGVGRTEIGGSNDTEINVGAGVFTELNRRLSVRADVRAVHSTDEGGIEPFAFIGLTATLGKIAPPPPPDSDGDGVADPNDRCPNTPPGVEVDANGCPLDDDGDGVPNYLDECPGTIAGAAVDAKGCHFEDEEAINAEVVVEFDFDSAELRANEHGDVRRFAEFMRQHPQAEALIEGHTDSMGTDPYNERLAQERARTVVDRLVEVEGIAASRITVAAYGESRPIASNDTDEGRQRNRRVVGEANAVRMVIRMK